MTRPVVVVGAGVIGLSAVTLSWASVDDALALLPEA